METTFTRAQLNIISSLVVDELETNPLAAEQFKAFIGRSCENRVVVGKLTQPCGLIDYIHDVRHVCKNNMSDATCQNLAFLQDSVLPYMETLNKPISGDDLAYVFRHERGRYMTYQKGNALLRLGHEMGYLDAVLLPGVTATYYLIKR